LKATALGFAAMLALLAPTASLAQGPEVADFNFYNTDLHLVLKALSEVTGASFVEDVPVSGKVTVHIAKRTGLDEVLETILKPLGLAWKTAGNVYHIGLKEGEKAAPGRPGYIQKTYSLKYVSAGEVARRLRKFLRAKGIVSVDPAMNRVTVTVPPALVGETENVVKAADVEVTRKQISIRIKLLEIAKDGTFSSSASMSWFKYNASLGVASEQTSSYPLGVNSGGGYQGDENGAFYNNAMTFRFGLWGIDQYTARLRLAETGNLVDTVSEPDVIVMDGQEATIKVGERVPFTPSYDTNQLDRYEEVGNSITVKPQVGQNGFITIELKATLTRRPYQYGRDLDSRYVDTTLTLLNGETGRVAGLMTQTETTTDRKIPLLGDIPLLGYLFKNHDRTHSRKEMVILVSPSVVEDVPPHCRNTPGISALVAWLMPGTTNVVLDWSEDVPSDNVGIFQYRIYRDLKPILSVARLKPVADSVSRAATTWADESPKRRGVTYYYAVTAVDGAGNEQAVSNSPAITVPKR
jgi:type II secretory pathway component GspD/PulD (secretin)